MFFQRLLRRTRKPGRQVRRLRMERLLSRELMAADYGAIGGVVVNDLQGNGVDAGDPVMVGVPVALFRDSNANGTFDAGVDNNVANAVTNATGEYLFDRLTEDRYFVVQNPTTSASQIAGDLVQTVDITAALARGISDQGQVLIDGFDGTAKTLANPVSPATPTQDTTNEAAILGGSRDILLTRTSAGGSVTITVNDVSAPGLFAYTANVFGSGTADVQWDGPDNDPTAFDPVGLGSVDLTQAGAEGFLVEVAADLAGSTFDLTFFSGAGNSSTFRINIQALLPASDVFTIDFDDAPMSTTGTGADFQNITGIRGLLDASPLGTTVSIAVVGAVAPGLVTTNFTNAIPITLGGTVFNDANNNGTFDGTESGINGVTVNLFEDTNSDGSLDGGDVQVGAATVTAGGGNYQFTGLFPGDYIVQIPQNQFALGNALSNFVTSLSPAAADDPDNDVNNDDNGAAVVGLGVASQAITLVSNGEPTNDGDTNNNTNLTLDFGFAPQVDVSIVKSVLSTNPVAGQNATYRLAIANSATSQTATNVVVTDTLPAGVSLVSVTLDGADVTGTTNVTGAVGTGLTLTLAATTLTAGQNRTIDVTVSVPSTGTGAFNNVASVASDGIDTDPANNDSNVDLNPDRVANLLLQKTASVTTVAVGDSYTYTLTVTNNGGPSSATGVVLVDQLPTGITFNSGTITRGGVASATGIAEAAGTVTATIGDMAVGEVIIVTLNVTATNAAVGTATNNASVTANENEPNPDPDPNTASVNVDVNAIVDLVLAKTSPATAIAGDQLTYTITVDNNGPATATNVSVVDTLPAGVTFDNGTGGTFDDSVAGQVTISVPDIAPGGRATLTMVVDVASNIGGTTVTNNVAVTSDEIELPATQGQETAAVSTNIVPSVDMQVTKVGQSATVIPGSQFSYTITVDNLGVSDATGVTLTDTLPAGVTLVSISEGGTAITNTATVNGQQVTLPVGTFTSTAPLRTFTYTVAVASSVFTDITNAVTVNSDQQANEVSLNNNSAQAVTTVTPNATLVIAKSDNVDPATPGSTVTYTITVQNTGVSDARNVVVTDSLPAGVTVESSSAPGGAGTVNGNVLTLQFGSVAAGATQSATVTVRIPGTLRNSISNSVSVAGSGVTGGTLSDTEATALTPQYDVTVTQSVSPSTVAAGSNVQFTVLVTNAASSVSSAVGVIVDNVLPAGLTFASASLNGTTLGSLSNIAIPNLAPGESATLLVNATVANSAANGQVLSNTANITTAPNETNVLTNNSTSAVTVDLANRSIAGRVVLDSNYNNLIDATELAAPGNGIPNATVTLRDNNNAVVATTMTAADGSYTFGSLLPGTYSVGITVPATNGNGQTVTWAQVNAIPGTAGGTGGTGATTTITGIPLTGANVNATSNNFAVAYPFSKWLFFG